MNIRTCTQHDRLAPVSLWRSSDPAVRTHTSLQAALFWPQRSLLFTCSVSVFVGAIVDTPTPVEVTLTVHDANESRDATGDRRSFDRSRHTHVDFFTGKPPMALPFENVENVAAGYLTLS